MNKKTTILHAAAAKDKETGALSVPIYNASTYHQADVSQRQPWEYGRSGNPTRGALEDLLAALEGGVAGFAFASGMAALTTAITAFVKSGDHIVAAQDLYGGSYRFLTEYINRFGVTYTFVDTTNPDAVEKAIQKNTTVLLLESPSNPLLKVTDLIKMASIAKSHGIISIIDNTFMSPYLQRPLDFGIDISVHSATKFLGGHSDLIAGAVITKTADHGKAVKFVQNTTGNILGPQDSWLLIRGIKTLSARMDAQGKSAEQLAQWLTKQSWVTDVFYPGLPNHPGHDIFKSQTSGFGSVVSINLDTAERVFSLMKKTKLWNVAVSLGGVESILSYPRMMSHASIPANVRGEMGITDTLIRLSVGLEDVGDLTEDLTKASDNS